MLNKPIILIIMGSLIIILLSLITRQQHLLPLLLCLERLILLIVLYIIAYKIYQYIAITINIIILLTLRVSGARIGLALLIRLRRKEGNDSTLLKFSKKS